MDERNIPSEIFQTSRGPAKAACGPGPRDVWNISRGMFLEFIIVGSGVLFWGFLNSRGLYSMYLSQLPNIWNSEDVNIKGEKSKQGIKWQKEIDLVDMVIGQYSSEIIYHNAVNFGASS